MVWDDPCERVILSSKRLQPIGREPLLQKQRKPHSGDLSTLSSRRFLSLSPSQQKLWLTPFSGVHGSSLLTVGTVVFTVESPVRCAVWVIPLADPTGVLGSIWPKDIVTANFLKAPQGHRPFMEERTIQATTSPILQQDIPPTLAEHVSNME